MSDMPLYLFAKAPEPGKVKTRMTPQLSAQNAAWLAAMMLRQSFLKCCRHWPGRVVLTISGDLNHTVFNTLLAENYADTSLQIHGNLGKRMAYVLQSGIEQAGAAVVMGCDVPHFPTHILGQVFTSLSQGRPIVGPAQDGGFYLLGLTTMPEALFDHIKWGGAEVLSALKHNAQALDIDLIETQPLRDIDHFEDLQWLWETDPQYRIFAPDGHSK